MRRELQRAAVDPELLQHLPRVPMSEDAVGAKVVIHLDEVRLRRRRLPCSRNSRLRIANDAVFDIYIAGLNPRRQREDDRRRIASRIRQQRRALDLVRVQLRQPIHSGLVECGLAHRLGSRTPRDSPASLRRHAPLRSITRKPARSSPAPAREKTHAASRRTRHRRPHLSSRCHEKLSSGKPPLPASCGYASLKSATPPLSPLRRTASAFSSPDAGTAGAPARSRNIRSLQRLRVEEQYASLCTKSRSVVGLKSSSG